MLHFELETALHIKKAAGADKAIKWVIDNPDNLPVTFADTAPFVVISEGKEKQNEFSGAKVNATKTEVIVNNKNNNKNKNEIADYFPVVLFTPQGATPSLCAASDPQIANDDEHP